MFKFEWSNQAANSKISVTRSTHLKQELYNFKLKILKKFMSRAGQAVLFGTFKMV